MAKHILIILGHPDASARHFCHALSRAYEDGAISGGHTVESIDLGRMDFPLLRSKRDWDEDAAPESLRQAQLSIKRADHLVIVYPLWLGGMPALLKGFLEQVLRPDIGFSVDGTVVHGRPLEGRSARVVVTMGMPAFIYRWYFGAHSLKSLRSNILGFLGVAPVRKTLIGTIESLSDARRGEWLKRLQRLGRDAS
ncbi:NAD(P)H-dependent oxidoreductase [Variovorax sp. J2P1-59]|uniref:NAD(P)H-dependent oxidoreductase n=1 Tax=Variovorax flavidus TaxID=3053501 RepID=UPI0025749B9C|nr:NAD(P)H-dependent oxidoreductase [Variovorax sp. J2P1-59]MDM0078607.1 NAD(P)H-dependent oxidoreductase [Variovorax sp. J2P1-59]